MATGFRVNNDEEGFDGRVTASQAEEFMDGVACGCLGGTIGVGGCHCNTTTRHLLITISAPLNDTPPGSSPGSNCSQGGGQLGGDKHWSQRWVPQFRRLTFYAFLERSQNSIAKSKGENRLFWSRPDSKLPLGGHLGGGMEPPTRTQNFWFAREKTQCCEQQC